MFVRPPPTISKRGLSQSRKPYKPLGFKLLVVVSSFLAFSDRCIHPHYEAVRQIALGLSSLGLAVRRWTPALRAGKKYLRLGMTAFPALVCHRGYSSLFHCTAFAAYRMCRTEVSSSPMGVVQCLGPFADLKPLICPVAIWMAVPLATYKGRDGCACNVRVQRRLAWPV